MKISYLVTCSTETDTLTKLLKKFREVLNNDEIVILMDEEHAVNTNKTYNIVGAFHHDIGSRILTHPLSNDYGAHKNFGIEHCSGDWIFQIDGDEMPPDSLLGENLHALIESNPTIEAYAIPRINDFRGVTEIHAKQWGWRLSESPSLKRPVVNFPDHQWRLFKRDYPRIEFKKRLHERIDGFKRYSILPPKEEWALYHDKTIETQLKTNLKYNQLFSEEDNRGHGVFR